MKIGHTAPWRRLILVGYLIILIAIVANGYAGRAQIVETQRTGCMRGIAPRIALINLSYAEAEANHAEAAVFDTATNPTARHLLASLVVDRYQEAAEQILVARQNATLVPAGDATQIPISLRHLAMFSCSALYPSPSLIP